MDSLSVVDIKRLIQSRIEVQTVLIDEIEADHITYNNITKEWIIRQLKYSIDVLNLLSGDVDSEIMNEYPLDGNTINDDNYRAVNKDDE